MYAGPMPKRPLLNRARAMRREPTEAESRLWRHLRSRQLRGAKFRRQEEMFGFIVDFVCEQAKLIIEVDGGQHTDEADAARTALLEAAGYTVLRFWNNDVLSNTEGVLTEIARTLRIATAPR